jgi:hypothetical protein
VRSDEDGFAKKISNAAAQVDFPRAGVYETILRRARRRRIALLSASFMGFAVLAGIAALLYAGFHIWPDSKSRLTANSSNRGHYIEFPDAPDTLGNDSVIEVETNLVDGTLIEVEFSLSTGSLVQITCCETVSEGMVTIGVPQVCPVAEPANTKVLVHLEARPVFQRDDMPCVLDPDGTQSCLGTSQPAPVRSVLGDRFERLEGEQVTVNPNGSRYIESTRTYDLSC